MAETNATAATSGGVWSKLGSLFTEKALDLADSYAAMKLGGTPANATTTATPAPSTSTPPPVVQPPSNNKLLIWIAGGIAVLALVLVVLRPSRR